MSALHTRRRDDIGLTMIELLVGIIIVGILAAIAIPVYNSQKSRAHNATLKRDLHNVAKSIEAWYADGKSNIQATDIGSGYMYMNANGLTVWPGTNETATPGLMPTRVTAWSGIGARVVNAQGGYCILGMRKGSKWQYGQTGVPVTYDHLLYYDSLSGGIKERSQLTSTGACQEFR